MNDDTVLKAGLSIKQWNFVLQCVDTAGGKITTASETVGVLQALNTSLQAAAAAHEAADKAIAEAVTPKETPAE